MTGANKPTQRKLMFQKSVLLASIGVVLWEYSEEMKICAFERPRRISIYLFSLRYVIMNDSGVRRGVVVFGSHFRLVAPRSIHAFS